MEVDFDKQIDTILRDLAKGSSFAEIEHKSHLDADELSAFAENVLPNKARIRAMEHLADCLRCRNILATFVSFDSDEESETIHEEVKTITVIPSVPWYKKLFAFPQMAYTMGAFVLLFSGVIALFIFQGSQSSEMSLVQVEKAPASKEISTTSDSAETYSANANSTSNYASNVAIPSANVATNSVVTADKQNVPSATPAPNATATPSLRKEDAELTDDRDVEAKKVSPKEDIADGPIVSATPEPNEANILRQQELPSQNRVMTPDDRNYRRDMPAPAPRVVQAPRSSDAGGSSNNPSDNKSEVARKKSSSPTIKVSGKTFERVNGIWTDLDYKGGKTTTVKRGTNNYKKLDSDLQNIGNSFTETIIVVWKGKNYKIQ